MVVKGFKISPSKIEKGTSKYGDINLFNSSNDVVLCYVIFYYALCNVLFVMAKATGVYLKCGFKAPVILLEVG